jgi:hypothetical protein
MPSPVAGGYVCQAPGPSRRQDQEKDSNTDYPLSDFGADGEASYDWPRSSATANTDVELGCQIEQRSLDAGVKRFVG